MQAKRDQDVFWRALDEGEFVAQKCARCMRLRHPPSPACARCTSMEWSLERLSGRGIILSAIVSAHPSRPEDNPRTVILVALEEGLHFVSNLIGPPASLQAHVELVIERGLGSALPLFRAAAPPIARQA